MTKVKISLTVTTNKALVVLMSAFLTYLYGDFREYAKTIDEPEFEVIEAQED